MSELTIHCDGCGYARTGLPAGAKCPECGDDPPVVVDDHGRTAGQAVWAACVAAGMLLVAVSTVQSLSSVTDAFYRPRMTAVVVNVPAPKLCADEPVVLTSEMSVLLTGAVGVWLATTRRTAHGTEPGRGVAKAARWASVISVGAVTGYIGYGHPQWRPMANNDSWRGLTLLLILLGQVPATTLLYVHLRTVARQLGRLDLVRPLTILAAVIGPVMAVSTIFMLFDRPQTRRGSGEMLLATAGYSAVALSTAVAAWVVFGRLWIAAVAAAFSPRSWWPVTPARLTAAGLLLWGATATAGALVSGFQLGDSTWPRVPATAFAGPSAVDPFQCFFEWAWVHHDETWNRILLSPAKLLSPLLTLTAAWWITAKPAEKFSRLRLPARWLPTVGFATLVGAGIGDFYPTLAFSRLTPILVGTVLFQAPATVVLYLYVAEIAARFKAVELAASIKTVAAAAMVAVLMPPLALLAVRHVEVPPESIVPAVVSVVEVTASLAVTCTAAACLVRLAWVIVVRKEPVDSLHVRPNIDVAD